MLDRLKPIGDLLIRFWIAKVFFLSGFTKIQSWSTTVALFKYEYQVPFLDPTVSAYLCVFIELVMPILLLLGLGQRVPAFILFIFNIVIVFSYPVLWSNISGVGFSSHVYWALLIMVIMLHGHGKLSLDYLIERWMMNRKINL